jgi:hypothetical protein
MPHKCTRCEKIFRDGDPVILSGCPECGWNKFLYIRPDVDKKEEIVLDESKQEIISSIEKEKKIESVKILSPGQYELNLEALLTRDEIIVALKEDGTYIIHLPSVFGKRRERKS